MFGKITRLLTVQTHGLGKWTLFLVFQVRIWFHCLRLLKINRCGTQASALAYHSIFGLVPLAIVGLMVFQMFPAFEGVSEKVKTFAYEQMNLTSIEYPAGGSEEGASGDENAEPEKVSVAQKLDELTEKYVSKASSGAITAVGLALVIWAAISLLTTTERAFNTIYHVSTGRNFLHRLFNYWALLTLGPILLGAGIYVSTQVMKHEFIKQIVSLEQSQSAEVDSDAVALTEPNAVTAPVSLSDRMKTFQIKFSAKVIPFFISLVAFFFLYFFLPNTRVGSGAALWGAFVASVLWTAAKIGFRYYIMNLPGFAVYGVLGIIPITVMWIYISWLIVLFGLQLTYATQNIKRLDAAELARTRRKDKCFLANDQTVIRVMEYVLNAFERKDQRPVSTEAVAYRLSMPPEFADNILEQMVRYGLLCHTNEPSTGYVPSTDGANITLDEISKAVSEVSFAQADAMGPEKMFDVFQEMRGHLSKFTLKQVLNTQEEFESQEGLAQDAAIEPEDGLEPPEV